MFDVSPVYRAAYDTTSVNVDTRGLDKMKCFYCNAELVWQSDWDNEEGGVTGFYICPNCRNEQRRNPRQYM